MRNENDKWEWEMWMRNEKWEWEWEMKNENEKWEMRIELWINKKTIFLISCQIKL